MPFEQIPYTNFHGTNQDWMIQQIKQMIADWASYRENLDAAWAAYQQNLNADWADYQENINNWRQALDAAFNQLHDYVYNYFDNLDVQEEINNKLDQMREAGVFDEILLPYFNSYTEEINGKILTQNNKISTVENQVNNFLENTGTLGTEKDAELIDIRVGANGITYQTAGEAVRDQLIGVSEYNNNLFIAENISAGTRINANGGIEVDENYFTSEFIPVVAGVTYEKNSPTEDAYHRICVYDYTRSPITSTIQNENVITIPKNGVYVKFCGRKTEISTVKFTMRSALDIYSRNDPIVQSTIGKTGIIKKKDSQTANASFNMPEAPRYLKKNEAITCQVYFESFTSLLIGKGLNTYRGDWITVAQSNVIFTHYEAAATEKYRVAHNLTISDFLKVILYHDDAGVLHVTISTKGGSFSCEYDIGFEAFSGIPFIMSGMDITNVILCQQSGDLRKPLWFVGDSYFGVNDQRVMGQIKNLGYWKGFACSALAGINSTDALPELIKMLNYGAPKYLIWYLGMNDTTEQFTNALATVKQLCKINNITLILNKVPTVPARDKEQIGIAVTTSGYRYINSYEAVGTNSNGEWYPGYLSTDKVHPTEMGAKALAIQAVLDVPEITMYGRD